MVIRAFTSRDRHIEEYYSECYFFDIKKNIIVIWLISGPRTLGAPYLEGPRARETIDAVEEFPETVRAQPHLS